MRYTITICMLLLVSLSAGGQSMMVGVFGRADGWRIPEEITPGENPAGLSTELMRNIESGLMASGFDQGYITFNTPAVLHQNPLESQDQQPLYQLARQNGVSILLVAEVRIEYLPTVRSVRAQGQLSMIEIATGRVLEQELLTDITPGNALADVEEISGRMILSLW
ncbi:hypothetical protein [Spirochaeta lutea]|nr:hypothetical protein [Spirochaeta lutea]